MLLQGIAHKYGDNVDTDVIMPARYITLSDPVELAAHAMEDIDRDFVGRVKQGDIMAAGENFGCGSSREHAPIGVKYAGIACIIAKSFARIFYRNAINTGLPILECPEAADGISMGDEVEVDLESGAIVNLTTGKTYRAAPFPPFIKRMIDAGGLLPFIRAKTVIQDNDRGN